MKGHVFRYRFLATLREPVAVFWVMIFPLLLVTVMRIVFSGLFLGELTMDPASGGILQNEYYSDSSPLGSTVKMINDDKSIPYTFTFYENEEDADLALVNGEIHGYFLPGQDDTLTLKVAKNGTEQTMLAEFQNRFLSQSKIYENLFRERPLEAVQLIRTGLPSNVTTFTPIDPGFRGQNPWASMLFAVLAMAALYGSMLAINEASAVDPRGYSVGLRQRSAPTNHLNLLSSGLAVAMTLSFGNLVIFIMYAEFALGIDFAFKSFPVLALAIAFFGALSGTALGFLISAFVSKQQTRYSVAIAVSMFFSFFAGMMFRNMRYIMRNISPMLGNINPADLITDAFAALVYYGDQRRALIDIAWLAGISLVCLTLAYFKLRRTRYAHL